jgi:DNA topoisomerase IB
LRAAAAEGLFFTTDRDPGIRRLRHGRGFAYQRSTRTARASRKQPISRAFAAWPFHRHTGTSGSASARAVTWYATIEALAILRKLPVGNPREVKRQLKKVVAAVAARLGNTPAICRRCYIHPEVLLAYADGHLATLVGAATTRALNSLLRKRSRRSR